MKIAVSQREIIIQNSTGESFVFDGIERAWNQFLSQHELIPMPNTINVDVDKFDYDCLLITGGPDSYARHMTENALYAAAVDRDIPIVGVCHGAFVINDIEGGVNGRRHNHMGTSHSVLMEGSTHTVNSYHTQCIDSISQDFEVIARDSADDIEGFIHKQKLICGIVWHPERMTTLVLPTVVKNLFNL